MTTTTDTLLALRAAFPRPEWDRATIDLYRAELAQLDEQGLVSAAQALIRRCVFRPSIAEIRAEHRFQTNELRRRNASTHGLAEPELSDEERAENVRRARALLGMISRPVGS